jgi:hypothetical protein
MNIVYHHRTRGRGAEGVHILGVFEALKTLGHKVTMLSFPGADPNVNTTESISKTKLTSKFNPLTYLANITNKLPQAFFELFEILYNVIAFFRLRKTAETTQSNFIYERGGIQLDSRSSAYLWPT